MRIVSPSFLLKSLMFLQTVDSVTCAICSAVRLALLHMAIVPKLESALRLTQMHGQYRLVEWPDESLIQFFLDGPI